MQVKTLSEEDVECIKNNDVDLNLSLYPLVWNSIDEIVEFIKEKQMEFTINDGAVFEFSSSFDLDSEDNYVEKRKKCDVQCVNLYRGYIAPCPIMMYVDFFNRYFEKDLPEEKPVKLSEVKDFVTLIELLHRPMEICRYCNQTKQHKWEHITDRSCIKIDKWLA